MTNISVNYDTKWLLNYYKTGDVGVFLKNVEMALRNGEPTLTLTSLRKKMKHSERLYGSPFSLTILMCAILAPSIFLISSIGELASVVELATVFLLCGTLVASHLILRFNRVRRRTDVLD